MVMEPNKAIVDYLIADVGKRRQSAHHRCATGKGWLPRQEIALSRGINDSGMFEFRAGESELSAVQLKVNLEPGPLVNQGSTR